MSNAGGSLEYIYGINAVFEVLLAGRRIMHRVLMQKGRAEVPRLRKMIALCSSRNVPVEEVEKGRLIDLARSRDHQGVVIETGGYNYLPWESLCGEERLLLLDNIEDPHNLGAILRSAEVLGFPAVCLPTRGVPQIYPSVVKVSAGACEHLRVSRCRSANQYARLAQEEGYTLAVLDAQGRKNLDEFAGQMPRRFMLVIGGEDKAVGRYILNAADETLYIDRRGKIGSLNASVAAAVGMYALRPRDNGLSNGETDQ